MEHVVACHIRVGATGVTRPIRAMGKIADVAHPGWFGVDPETLRCERCGLEWSELSSTLDLKTASCSNCYSDDVLLVAIRVGMFPEVAPPSRAGDV